MQWQALPQYVVMSVGLACNLAEACQTSLLDAPRICSLPQSLHFSQPTQSMTRVMFWKCFCRSRFNSAAFVPFHNRPSSKGMGQAFLSASLLTCKTGSQCKNCPFQSFSSTSLQWQTFMTSVAIADLVYKASMNAAHESRWNILRHSRVKT